MAKISMKHRDYRRERASTKAWGKRHALKAKISSSDVSFDEKMAAVAKLNSQPRNQSASRVQRRCHACGRPHAVYRKFKLCRICLRIAAMGGHVPGLSKASWEE